MQIGAVKMLVRAGYLLLTSAILTSAVTAADPPEGWQEVKLGDGKVRVITPKAEQTHNEKSTQNINGKPREFNFTLIGAGDDAFGLVLLDNLKDANKTQDPQKLLTALRTAVLDHTKAKLVSEKKITFGDKKYPGREYIAQAVHDGTPLRIRGRMYLMENDGVSLFAITAPNRSQHPSVEQFLKSLEWNPPSAEKKDEKKKDK